MKKIALFLCAFAVAAFALVTVAPQEARADGCYICTSGSADQCKDYCKYVGDDTWDNRKACEAKGCKVGGTASCPTAVNYKVCDSLLEIPFVAETVAVFDLFASAL